AHAAAGDDGQGGVPAVVGDEHPALEGRLDQVQLLAADIDRLVVDEHDRHDLPRSVVTCPGSPGPGAWPAGPRCSISRGPSRRPVRGRAGRECPGPVQTPGSCWTSPWAGWSA